MPGVTEGGLGVAQARALLPLDGLVLTGGEAQARVVMVIAVVSSVIVRGLCSRVMRPGEDGGHRGARGEGVRGVGGVRLPVLRQRVMRMVSSPG